MTELQIDGRKEGSGAACIFAASARKQASFTPSSGVCFQLPFYKASGFVQCGHRRRHKMTLGGGENQEHNNDLCSFRPG